MNPYLRAASQGNIKLMKKLESEGQNIHIKNTRMLFQEIILKL